RRPASSRESKAPLAASKAASSAVSPAGLSGGRQGARPPRRPRRPPPPPPSPPRPRPAAVRVVGAIKPPMRTKNVNPTYPPIAQSARVQGVVIIEATIGTSGKVTDAKVLRSIPLLDAAALEAVKQWEYTPTTLNGQPVPVIMTVTVKLTLHSTT